MKPSLIVHADFQQKCSGLHDSEIIYQPLDVSLFLSIAEAC